MTRRDKFASDESAPELSCRTTMRSLVINFTGGVDAIACLRRTIVDERIIWSVQLRGRRQSSSDISCALKRTRCYSERLQTWPQADIFGAVHSSYCARRRIIHIPVNAARRQFRRYKSETSDRKDIVSLRWTTPLCNPQS